MKKLIIVLSVAATAAITGCSKDDLTSPKALQNKNTTAATTDVSATDQRLINSGSVLVPAPNQGYVKVFLFGAAKLSADHPETFVDINKRDVSQRAFDASFKAMYVKFNERCFARLLGDMRSYNFVIDITPDIEDYQYRLRAIDFDQQSYEGRKNLYLPQFYKENFEFAF